MTTLTQKVLARAESCLINGAGGRWCGASEILPIIQELLELNEKMVEALERIGHRSYPEEFGLDKAVGYLSCCDDVIRDANKILAEHSRVMTLMGGE